MNQRNESDTEVIDLGSFDEEFAKAGPLQHTEGVREEIPDGIYDTRVEEVSLRRAPSTGNPMIVYRLRILGPACEGRSISKIRVVTSRTLSFVKEDFNRLHLPVQSLREFQDNPAVAVDQEVRIYKRMKPGSTWTDVIFIDPDTRRKAPARESADGNGWFTGTDDDLPF